MCGGNLQLRPRGRVCGGSIPACAGEPPVSDSWDIAGTVYPRVCGGTLLPAGAVPALGGLSPRVRGNPDEQRQSAHHHRSIPACAGEPLPSPSVVQHGDGLSPRVRGNPALSGRARWRIRSIPACAGEPVQASIRLSSEWVYPRVCGGTGGGGGPVSIHSCPGSIPACAGEPAAGGIQPHGIPVYPRVCGGTTAAKWAEPVDMGLSPRVRGNPARNLAAAKAERSIPACAGEPGRAIDAGHHAGVYPRVCGGTASLARRSASPAGLSPRVRGNRAFVESGAGGAGSIPACAGEPG